MRCWALGLLAACGFEASPTGSIDAQATIDAASDARAFDPAADCPASYILALPGQASRYRLILAGDDFGDQSTACAAHKPGATHLAALDTIGEIAAVQAVVDVAPGLAQSCAWIGGVQLRGQTGVTTGWLKITGGPLTPIWDTGEPNDGGDYFENNSENFAFLGRGRRSQIDVPAFPSFGAMCECDGKPIDPAASAAILASQ